MKVLNVKRVSLVLGLAMGIMALWLAATPIAMGADSAIGGWVWVDECTPCCGQTPVTCNVNDPYPADCTSSETAYVCDVSGSCGDCDLDDETPCNFGNDACLNAKDTDC